MKSLYRKFTDQVAADAANVTPVHPHRNAFAWLAGEWRWQDKPVRFSTAPYGIALYPSGDPFLIHNAASDMWVLVVADPTAYGILIGTAMRRGEARFTGEVTIASRTVQLRQIWRRIDDETVEIENHRFKSNRWQTWDRGLFKKFVPGTNSV
ncbi:MAG: hypothetical protein HYX27_03900 [Acidobacteria bacterium]|nr:hypothetical protein [Acidobacteriota bacterium]